MTIPTQTPYLILGLLKKCCISIKKERKSHLQWVRNYIQINDHRIRRYQSINRYQAQSLIGHARTYVRVHNTDDYRLKNHGGKPDFGLSLQQCATLRDCVMAKGKSQMHSTYVRNR